jgi:hypothetical protein
MSSTGDYPWDRCEPCWKRGYYSCREAKKAEKVLVRLNGDKASHLDVYRCPHNPRIWHVGHNRQSRQAAY